MASPGPAPDLVGTTKYPLVVSKKLLDGGKEAHSYSSLQLNVQPKLSTAVRSRIVPSKSGGHSCDLIVAEEDSNQKYVYAGSVSSRQAGHTTCVLAFDPARQAFVLDALDAEFKFNVTSTPSNQSAKALATAHPQLNLAISEPMTEDDLFDEDTTSEGDPENPYDYRHYLKRPSSSPDPIDSLETLDAAHLGSSPPSQSQSHTPKATTRDSRYTKARIQRLTPNPSPDSHDETDADNEDSSDDGSLEIVLEGAKSNPFQGKYSVFGSRGNSGSPSRVDDHDPASNDDAVKVFPTTGHTNHEPAHEDDDDEVYDAMAEAIEAELEKQEQETNHTVDLEMDDPPLVREAESSSESEEE